MSPSIQPSIQKTPPAFTLTPPGNLNCPFGSTGSDCGHATPIEISCSTLSFELNGALSHLCHAYLHFDTLLLHKKDELNHYKRLELKDFKRIFTKEFPIVSASLEWE